MASELDYKNKFAEYLVEGYEPLEAAMRTFKPDGYTNASFLLKIAKEWPKDEEVIAIKKEIDANTTSEVKFKAYLMKQAKKCAGTREEPAMLRLFAEVSGFIKAGSKAGNAKDSEDKLHELRAMMGMDG